MSGTRMRVAMGLAWFLVLLAAGAPGALAAGGPVTSPDGQVLRTRAADGTVVAEQLPPRPLAISGAGSASGVVVRESYTDPATGATVDPEGRIQGAGGQGGAGSPASASVAAVSPRITIDQMTTRNSYSSYDVVQGLGIIGRADVYTLSDGSTWRSGAGSATLARARFDRVEVLGSLLRYHFDPPADGVLYQQTDYNSGNHSAQGTLGAAGPLVLEATLGSTTATLLGQVEVVANDATWYGEPRFNYYSAPVGSVVPIDITYTLLGGATWSATTFGANFPVSNQGIVDFAAPISVPQPVSLQIQGSSQLPEGTTTQYFAVVTYDSGFLSDVTATASWAVQPGAQATVSMGTVTTSGSCAGSNLTLRADYTEGGITVSDTKAVTCQAGGVFDDTDAWETFQGDPGHSGYVPIPVEPGVFSVRWQRALGGGLPLNPVTAADGKVFVSLKLRFVDTTGLFVLDARDGATLWSRGFGRVNSVNPPAYGYGNVYLQTGNHSNDTFLWAFEADTGAQVFRAPHNAQWERYLAPTVYKGGVYVNGGTYGGMYSFSAFSGSQNWFLGLPQYDEWTPAVDDRHAYAYVGEYQPGLYVADRISGAQVLFIPDPNFSWNGWSMRLAPVLGGMNDVLAIHDGRLIRFDVATGSIAWELAQSFSGQPSVARGVVYALDGGALVALDQATGARQWSWQPPAGQLTGSLIVTDTHVLVSSDSEVYAVEILSQTDVWSYPVAGHLALGEEILYVASADGMLTAISTPEYTPAALLEIDVTGPAQVVEKSVASFQARAYYSDGRIRDRTALAQWSVDPDGDASIDALGQLSLGELLAPTREVIVRASYTEGPVSVDDEVLVELVIGVSLDEFVDRNLLAARQIKGQVLQDLDAARVREEAAMAVLRAQREEADGPWLQALRAAVRNLRAAMFWGWVGHLGVERSAEDLDGTLGALEGGG